MRRLSADPSRRVRAHLNLGSLTQVASGAKAGVSAGTTTAALGTGIASAIGAGAAAGSVVPIVGTAIGVLVALAVSGVFSHKVDPEVGNFNNAVALVNQQGPTAVLNIQDKYLVLAGLFDLEPSQIKGNIPIYKKYGRMGEQKFVGDMCVQIQNAANRGIITDSDTVQSVYSKVVLPWINSFGFGAMSDTNGTMITYLLMGLIGEYVTGQYTQRWFAVGGQMPFGNLPPFHLPTPAQPVAPKPTASPTPSPQAVAPSQQSAQGVATQSAPSELAQYQSGVMPPFGSTIHYARSNTGQFLALPQAATMQGADNNAGGAWQFSIGGALYEVIGSTITPYPQPSTSSSANVPGVQTVQAQVNQQVAPTSVVATDSSGASIPAQYIPGPVSSGGALVTPQSVLTPSSSVINFDDLWIGGAVLLGVLFLTMHKGAR